MITFSTSTSAPFEFETTATYSCNPGFGLSVGDSTRTCGGDGSSPTGTWSGGSLTCESNVTKVL